MFAKILTAVVAALVLGVGGYYTYTEFINPEKEEVAAETTAKAEEKKEKEFKDEEIKTTAAEVVEEVYKALNKGREEYGFVKGNYDIEKLNELVKPIATENFLKNKMPGLAESTYCDCDANMKPNLAFDSRVDIAKEEDSYVVKVIEAGTDMDNNAYLFTIKLVNEGTSLKVDDWSSEQPAKDLKLSKDEALTLLASNYKDSNYKYVSEYDVDEDTIYVFEEGDNKIGINSANGMLTYQALETADVDEDSTEDSETTDAADNVERTSDEKESESATESEESTSTAEQESSTDSTYTASEDDFAPFHHIDDLKRSKEARQVPAGETLGNAQIYSSRYEDVNLQVTEKQMIALYGEPLDVIEFDEGKLLEYSDAIYTVATDDGLIDKVLINASKAESLYSSFDEIQAAYDDFWGMAPKFVSELQVVDGRYMLVFDDGYAQTHTYTSSNESGNPLFEIEIDYHYY
ncbi:hypothetical protein SFC66_04565 [Terribacillus saccharophilus]|uniref:hypothetical protein n=1 Tax=Terribacillus saccharophilus TaxID=361277 RepID=UPI00398229FE